MSTTLDRPSPREIRAAVMHTDHQQIREWIRQFEDGETIHRLIRRELLDALRFHPHEQLWLAGVIANTPRPDRAHARRLFDELMGLPDPSGEAVWYRGLDEALYSGLEMSWLTVA